MHCNINYSFARGAASSSLPRRALPARRDVVEADQIDVLALAVLSDLQQVDDTEESGGARQLGRDIGKTDRRDRIDLNLAFFHWVARAHFDMRTHPDPDAASDLRAADAITQTLGKHHRRKCTKK